jgi:membrane peptidoglycan carboxypeptidase
MYQVTQPGYLHTAGQDGLPGIDLGGKTGTAQVMSHEALGKTGKGRSTNPNVWFVGVVPRRNPELVVAVLWQNGQFSYYPARIGARVVAAYVEKQRRIANNLVTPKTSAPVEMSAVWTVPGQPSGKQSKASGQETAGERVQTGNFLIDHGQIVSQTSAQKQVASAVVPASAQKPRAPSLRVLSGARVGNHESTPATPHQPQSGSNPQPAIAGSGRGQ